MKTQYVVYLTLLLLTVHLLNCFDPERTKIEDHKSLEGNTTVVTSLNNTNNDTGGWDNLANLEQHVDDNIELEINKKEEGVKVNETIKEEVKSESVNGTNKEEDKKEVNDTNPEENKDKTDKSDKKKNKKDKKNKKKKKDKKDKTKIDQTETPTNTTEIQNQTLNQTVIEKSDSNPEEPHQELPTLSTEQTEPHLESPTDPNSHHADIPENYYDEFDEKNIYEDDNSGLYKDIDNIDEKHKNPEFDHDNPNYKSAEDTVTSDWENQIQDFTPSDLLTLKIKANGVEVTLYIDS